MPHELRHNWPAAVEVLERAHRLAVSDEFRVGGIRCGIVGLAWTYAMLGRQADGLALLTSIAEEEELHVETWSTMACALAGLEAACKDDAEYETVCRRINAARADKPLPLV